MLYAFYLFVKWSVDAPFSHFHSTFMKQICHPQEGSTQFNWCAVTIIHFLNGICCITHKSGSPVSFCVFKKNVKSLFSRLRSDITFGLSLTCLPTAQTNIMYMSQIPLMAHKPSIYFPYSHAKHLKLFPLLTFDGTDEFFEKKKSTSNITKKISAENFEALSFEFYIFGYFPSYITGLLMSG